MYSLKDTYKKNKSRSTVYVIVAGVAALLAIAAIWRSGLSGNKTTDAAVLSGKLEEERQVLRNDVVLHEHFRKLQDLDEKYAMFLVNSPSSKQVDSFNTLIGQAEKAMKISLDSVSTQSTKYNAWANVTLSDSIVSAFRKALVNRRYMAAIRNTVAGRPVEIQDNDKELMQLQFDMQKKDERIALLERDLRAKENAAAQPGQAEKTQAGIAAAQLEKEKESLQKNLKEEEMRNTGLLDLTRSLKSDNEKLLAELNKSKKNNISDDASAQTARNKINSLQDQIDELNAALNFASIDCNLTRADARKIISNSRQRKELLADALRSLQDLSRSGNTDVQKKAKEKLAELNQIASTVRD